MKNKFATLFLFVLLSGFFTARGEYNTFHAIVVEPGTLKEALGDKWDIIDSLVVRGPINAEDFEVIYHGIRFGRLDVLNLENASLENNELPSVAFCKDDGYRAYVRRVILPDNIERFGKMALYMVAIDTINIPSSLQELGIASFAFSQLGLSTITIPEGVKEIPHSCFMSVEGPEQAILPSTIETIDIYGFSYSTIKDVIIPEAVDSIGMYAFFYSLQESFTVPASCTTIGMHPFSCCRYLKDITVLSEITTLPEGFVYLAVSLEKVTLPSTIKTFGKQAFAICESLTTIDLPYQLETIGEECFLNCHSLDSIVLPPTLQHIGKGAFMNCTGMDKIYSLAQTPPTCEDAVAFIGVPQDIPVYIPIGTMDSYQNAQGWKYFTNFIETENFPNAVIDVVNDPAKVESRVYWSNNGLVIETEGMTHNPVEYYVYTLDGKLVDHGIVTEAGVTLQIPQGAYIVRVANKVHKVM